MIEFVPINLAVEDDLSEAVVYKILNNSKKKYAVGACHKKGGFGYLKKKIEGFNRAAKGTPFFVLTDLDKDLCAPQKISEWLPGTRNHNLIFRIAVRAVEAWLMADRSSFAQYLAISRDRIPHDPDEIIDPKTLLLELAKHSRKQEIREALLPKKGSTARVGPDYNGSLIAYVLRYWKVQEAMLISTSLDAAVKSVDQFVPELGPGESPS